MTMKYIAFAAFVAFASPVLAEGVDMNDSDLTALDKDGDGAVSKSEFDAFTGFAFERMDADASGALTADEVDDHVIGDAFSMLDDNGDGSVSADEFNAQMDEDFDAADRDGDGMLN